MIPPAGDRAGARVRQMREDGRLQRYLVVALMAVAALWITLGMLASVQRSPVDGGAMRTAWHLAQAVAGQHTGHRTGSESPAGYPVVLTAIALATPGTAQRLTCWHGPERDACAATQLPWVLAVQLVAALVTVLIVHRLALRLSGSRGVAIVAAVLTVASMRLGQHAGIVLSLSWPTFLLLAAALLVVSAHDRRSVARAAAAGAVLAGAALFEPLVAIIVPIVAIQLAVVWREPSRQRAWCAGLALAIAAATVGFGLLALAVSGGYDERGMAAHLALHLAQRLAFADIERSSSLAAVALSVPLLSDLAFAFLPASEVRLLTIGAPPGSLNAAGTATYRAAFAAAGGSGGGAWLALAGEAIGTRPLAWLGSTVPVLARGLLAGGGIIALVGLCHVPRMLAFARADGRLGAHLLVVIPALVLLLVNALLTANAFWLNPVLPFIYAYAIAYVAGGW